MAYLVVLLIALAAGTLSGVIGTGSSMLLMPALVLFFGPQQAVPIMAIAAVMGNLGKVLAWRRVVDWRACAAFASTAVPGAVLGVHTLLALPPATVETALGLFFIAMIPARRWLARRGFHVTRLHLALLGGPVGWLTGIVVSTGPITVPIFIGHGLTGGAFLATESAASVAVYVAKVVAFQGFGALPVRVVLQGLFAGAALMAGAFFARHIVQRLSAHDFRRMVDVLMLVSGLTLLWTAWR